MFYQRFTLTFTSFVLLETHIFAGTSLATLQLPLHLSILIMNGWQLSLIGFKSIRLSLTLYRPLIRQTFRG